MSRDSGRILDAATNRAAEALRVMEDAARFLVDDRALTEELKQLRHDVRTAAPAISGRDTAHDVGTDVTTESEVTRGNARSVVEAACKRLQESLRSLEEWSKLPSQEQMAAPEYEAMRYRAYTLEQRLMSALPRAFSGWRLCLLLTESLCAAPWLDVARAAIDGGADCVQLREKDLPDRELFSRALALVKLGVDVVVNDRPDVALAAGARAVHLGQTDLPLDVVRAIVGERVLVGVSTSNLDEARAAAGADYCGVGPMFSSTTKAKPALSGPDYLHDYLAQEPALPPALAISGVTPGTLPALVEAAGGRPFGVAVSSYICAADDPGAATRAVLEAMP